MHHSLRLLCLPILALLALTPASAARAPAPLAIASMATSPAGQSYVWTGRVKGEGSGWTDYVNPEVTADSSLAELAKIRAALQVDRKFDAALDRVNAVHVWAALARDYDKKGELLVQVALLRSEILAGLGRSQDAERALGDLYLPEVPKGFGGWELAPAEKATLEAQSAWLADPRLEAARAKLSAGTTGGASDEQLRRYVTALLDQQQPQQVREIGMRAVPYLRSWVEGEWIVGGGGNEELRAIHGLTAWISIDRAGSARYLLEHFDSMNTLRRMRYLKVAREEGFSDDAWTKTTDTTVAPSFRAQEWLTLLARMLSDPELCTRAIPLVNRVADNDALTPVLQAALSKILDSGTEEQALAVLEATAALVRPSVYPLMLAALDSPFPQVRSLASKRILVYRSPTGLARFATHADPVVRSMVAESLSPRQVLRRPLYLNPSNDWVQVTPVPNAEEQALLEKLLDDPEASVASSAARSLLAFELERKEGMTGLSDAAVLRISRLPDPQLQKNVLRLRASPATTAAILRNLLDSRHELGLYDAIDQKLVASIFALPPEDDRIVEFLPVLRRRLQEGALRIPAGGDPRPWLEALARNPKSLASLMDWARDGVPGISYRVLCTPYLVGMETEAGGNLLRKKEAEEQEASSVYPPPRVSREGWISTHYHTSLRALSDEHVATLLRAVLESQAFEWPSPMVEVLHHEYAARKLLVRRLAQDPKEAAIMRWAALGVLAANGAPEARDVFFELLAATRGDSELVTLLLISVAHDWQLEDKSKFVRELMARPALPDALVLCFVDTVYGSPSAAGVPADVAHMVLERWMGPKAKESELLWRSLAVIALEPREKQGNWLVQALHNPVLTDAAVAAIESSQDAGHIDTVGQAIGFEWIPDVVQRNRHQVRAANYLANTLNERAVEYLLKAMTLTRDDATRDKILHGLDLIRRYSDERARWAGGHQQESARAAAIVELLPMLDDKDAVVRASAARSLGALRAVEHLPKLVRLLKDGDKSVAAAAQRAIDQITEPEPQKAPDGAPDQAPGSTKPAPKSKQDG